MNNKIHVLLIITLFTICGCRVNGQIRTATTEAERFRLASDYSRDQRGLSVLVMKGDKIVYEDYQNGHAADEPWMLASGTKSFTGVMLAAAIEDKLVIGFDEKVSDTITEWRADKRRSQITLRQLLSLESGLDAGKIGFPPSYLDAISTPAAFDPGTHFQYGPAPFQVFGEVMTRKLKPKGETVMQYLHRRILDPIGLKVASWNERDGQPMLPQGASLTAREWVKFGLFLKNGGKWNGKQIISKKLLEELVKSSPANPAYGISFWLNHPGIGPGGGRTRRTAADETIGSGVSDEVKDLFMAAGAANQRLYIIPSLDMVVVRQGRLSRWDDREFISRLLRGKPAK